MIKKYVSIRLPMTLLDKLNKAKNADDTLSSEIVKRLEGSFDARHDEFDAINEKLNKILSKFDRNY